MPAQLRRTKPRPDLLRQLGRADWQFAKGKITLAKYERARVRIEAEVDASKKSKKRN